MAESRKQFVMPSGFIFDYTYLLDSKHLTSESQADLLAARLRAAHAAVEGLRQTGEVPGHLSKDGTPEKVCFTKLPFVEAGSIHTPESLERLKAFGQSMRYQTDAVVSFGIGGSYLGNKVIFDFQCGEFWNSKTTEERQGYPQYYFSGQNLDPRRTQNLIDHLLQQAHLKRLHHGATAQFEIALIVISKSGSTIDTMATFMTVYQALKQQASQIKLKVAAVTDPAEGEAATLLHRLAKQEGWPLFSVPDGVGGRFSVFSEVGLITAAAVGFDIDSFLQGARDTDLACRSENFEQNPALLNGALKYLAGQKFGCPIEVFMPYGDDLKSLAEWYVQLLAESLGKRVDRQGEVVHYGRTPVVAVGTTDMHAQTQLHQDGPRDKIVQFVQVANWEQDPAIPDAFFSEQALTDLSGITLSEALTAALQANEQALAQDGRFSARLILPKLNAYYLGSVMYFLALSIAYEGELANVDAYDQPGVEAYKRILGPLIKELKAQKNKA